MNNQELTELYTLMYKSRRFEERSVELWHTGDVTGSLHPYIGEEAIACTATKMMKEGDLLTSTHRGVGHCVACGMDLNKMMAEFFGKATGYSGGRGGSMHMFSMEEHNIGTNGIVGGGTSLACGAAMTLKWTNKSDNVVFCFFGEGGSNEGVTHESMNLASVWKLPVIFVCENNGYEVFTSAEDTVSVKDVAVRAAGYDMPGHVCDGNDVFEIEKCYKQAIERARKGEGPSLVECKTYRWEGHWPLDVYAYGGYRSKEEVDAWKEKCPIKKLGEYLKANNIITAEELENIHNEINEAVEASVRFAEASPEPPLSAAFENLFQE
jgi:TPP-dependent pyruvate/acetoin dehydrogenase alpha subunit